MHTIRQQGGLSGELVSTLNLLEMYLRSRSVVSVGFTKRGESIYDPFGAGHSSTSISAALGMAVGRDFKGRNNNVVAVSFII